MLLEPECCSRSAGVDQGRLNIGRHGLIMTIKNLLNEHGVSYSLPTFRGGGGYGPGPMGNMSPPSQPVQQAVSRASQSVRLQPRHVLNVTTHLVSMCNPFKCWVSQNT